MEEFVKALDRPSGAICGYQRSRRNHWNLCVRTVRYVTGIFAGNNRPIE